MSSGAVTTDSSSTPGCASTSGWGARVSTPMPKSLLITGTVAEWEAWTEMAFPDSADYVFPHGLAPVHIDRSSDLGTYWEPNVWMLHPDIPS
jgi:hypothetical protein